MRNRSRQRLHYAIVIVMIVLTLWTAGCLGTADSESGEFLMEEDFYILLGINMAIFFGFLAIFAFRAGKRTKQGNKMIDATLKPGSATTEPPPKIVPDNSKLCKICNTVNPSNQRFCIGCGFRL